MQDPSKWPSLAEAEARAKTLAQKRAEAEAKLLKAMAVKAIKQHADLSPSKRRKAVPQQAHANEPFSRSRSIRDLASRSHVIALIPRRFGFINH